MIDTPVIVGITVAVVVVGSLLLTRVSAIPYPVFLVMLAIAIGFVPGVPALELNPDVIFYVFLPPLIYHAAFLIAPRDLVANWVPIALLALGLVLATLFGVALVSWAAVAALAVGPAFVLGAVVSPTDPVAATAVISRLGAPRRLSTILEAEGLINDGIGLVIYVLAVDSVTGGSFSVLGGIGRFFEVALGGVAIGLAIGWVVARVRRTVDDTETEIIISLLTPYAAYLAADRAGLSGVLATVTIGVYLGAQSEGIFRPGVRLQAYAFWEVLVFLLESVLFVLLGLVFPSVLDAVSNLSAGTLAYDAILVSIVAIAVRMAWQFVVLPLVWLPRRRAAGPPPDEPWQNRLLLGWSGMRGALSLAAALAIPLTARGQPFPSRDLVLFLTFSVIIATLVGQGTTLPTVIRRLGLAADRQVGRGELEARQAMIQAAIDRAGELVAEHEEDRELIDSLRETLELQRRRFAPDGAEPRSVPLPEYRWIRRELIGAQRAELNRRYRAGQLPADAARRIRRELDLEESMFSE